MRKITAFFFSILKNPETDSQKHRNDAAQPVPGDSPIGKMPKDVWRYMFLYLPPQALPIMASVNKFFKQIHNEHWQAKYHTDMVDRTLPSQKVSWYQHYRTVEAHHMVQMSNGDSISYRKLMKDLLAGLLKREKNNALVDVMLYQKQPTVDPFKAYAQAVHRGDVEALKKRKFELTTLFENLMSNSNLHFTFLDLAMQHYLKREKQQILDYFYELFCQNYHKQRQKRSEMRSLLRGLNGNLLLIRGLSLLDWAILCHQSVDVLQELLKDDKEASRVCKHNVPKEDRKWLPAIIRHDEQVCDLAIAKRTQQTETIKFLINKVGVKLSERPRESSFQTATRQGVSSRR